MRYPLFALCLLLVSPLAGGESSAPIVFEAENAALVEGVFELFRDGPCSQGAGIASREGRGADYSAGQSRHFREKYPNSELDLESGRIVGQWRAYQDAPRERSGGPLPRQRVAAVSAGDQQRAADGHAGRRRVAGRPDEAGSPQIHFISSRGARRRMKMLLLASSSLVIRMFSESHSSLRPGCIAATSPSTLISDSGPA